MRVRVWAHVRAVLALRLHVWVVLALRLWHVRVHVWAHAQLWVLLVLLLLGVLPCGQLHVWAHALVLLLLSELPFELPHVWVHKLTQVLLGLWASQAHCQLGMQGAQLGGGEVEVSAAVTEMDSENRGWVRAVVGCWFVGERLLGVGGRVVVGRGQREAEIWRWVSAVLGCRLAGAHWLGVEVNAAVMQRGFVTQRWVSAVVGCWLVDARLLGGVGREVVGRGQREGRAGGIGVIDAQCVRGCWWMETAAEQCARSHWL